MADGKKDSIDKPAERKAETPAVETPRLEREIPGVKPEIPGEKKEVKKETTKGTSEIRREIFRAEIVPDRETPSNIDALDINKGLETKEQKKDFNDLKLVTTTTLLGILYQSGLKPEFLRNLTNMASIRENTLPQPNNSETSALKKLKEIASHPNSTLYGILNNEWQRMVERSHEIYIASKQVELAMFGGKPEQPAVMIKPGLEKPQEKKEEGFLNSAKKFVQDHPVLVAGIALAGTYGIYKIFSGPAEENTGKKKGVLETILGDKWGKRIKYGLGVGLGIFVLGRFLNAESIRDWLKKKSGIDITGNRLSQFIVLLSEGKIVDAFKTLLSGPDEHFATHKKMAEKISKETGTKVSPETLKAIGNMRYDEFMSIVGKGKSAVVELIAKIPIPGITMLTGDPKIAAEEQNVRKYFETHNDQINKFKNDATTVDDVLIKLEGSGALETAPETKGLELADNKLDSPEKQKLAREANDEIKNRWISERNYAELLPAARKLKIDTKKIDRLIQKRKTALDTYTNAKKNNADAKVIAAAAQTVLDANNELGNELNKLTDELKYKHGWDETKLLAITHSSKIFTWIGMPQHKKEYGIYLLEKYIKKPYEAARGISRAVTGEVPAELVGREFKAGATVTEIEQEISRTRKELDTAKHNQPEYERLYAENRTNEKIETDHHLNEKKIKLLEKDLEIHEKRKTMAALEKELLDLKSKGGNPKKIAEIEKRIAEHGSILRTIQDERFKIQGEYLELHIKERRFRFEKEFGERGKQGILRREYIEQMDQLEKSISSHRKQLDRAIAERMKEAETLAKQGKDIKPICREINELYQTRVRIDVGGVDAFQSLAKRWTRDWKIRRAIGHGAVTTEAEGLMNAEANKMRRLFVSMMEGGQVSTEKTGVSKTYHLLKGKFYFYLPFIAVGTALHMFDKQNDLNFYKAIGQATVDTLPVVSTFSDFYSVITGKEYVTERKLDSKDRTVRALFGVGSAFCDATAFAGAAKRLRMGYTTIKEGRTIGKSVHISESLRAARAPGGKEIDSIEALREMSQTGRWIQQIAFAGALGLAGYSLIYQPVAERELSAETKAILGNTVKDLDIEPPKIDHKLPGT